MEKRCIAYDCNNVPSKNISCFIFPPWYGEQLGQNKYRGLELTGQVQLKICFMQPKFYRRLLQAGHGVHSKACQNKETTQTSKRSYSNNFILYFISHFRKLFLIAKMSCIFTPRRESATKEKASF